MDLADLIYLMLTRGPFVLPLLYVLTILLRVACHFGGVEIPALGRAFATAGATSLLSIGAATLLLSYLGPIDASPDGFFILFVILLLTLFVNMAVCIVLYRLLLPVRFSQALRVWSIQAASFVAIFVAGAGVIAAPVYLFFS